jgi:hypothetical protein
MGRITLEPQKWDRLLRPNVAQPQAEFAKGHRMRADVLESSKLPSYVRQVNFRHLKFKR